MQTNIPDLWIKKLRDVHPVRFRFQLSRVSPSHTERVRVCAHWLVKKCCPIDIEKIDKIYSMCHSYTQAKHTSLRSINSGSFMLPSPIGVSHCGKSGDYFFCCYYFGCFVLFSFLRCRCPIVVCMYRWIEIENRVQRAPLRTSNSPVAPAHIYYLKIGLGVCVRVCVSVLLCKATRSTKNQFKKYFLKKMERRMCCVRSTSQHSNRTHSRTLIGKRASNTNTHTQRHYRMQHVKSVLFVHLQCKPDIQLTANFQWMLEREK